MRLPARLQALRADREGSALIEFALLAPLLIMLIMGVFQIGMQMQSYNAMRSAMADTARFTVIQAQRDQFDNITTTSIQDAGYGIAMAPPYALKGDRLDINANEEASEVTDARKFVVTMTYEPENLLGFRNINLLTLNYERSIYVQDAP